MGIYRGPGGTGDATNDASSEASVVVIAKDAALAAQTAAEAAQAGAVVAESNAVTAASNAATSATNAAASATTALGAISSTQAAATQASDASLAAQAAQTAAETAETNAETAETNANASAALAQDWATKTTGPVADGEYSAKYNAQQASTAATNASNSATAAASSASTASTAATNAAASYDSFDDRYLGAKSSAPTVDNDGNTLLIGALYFNSVSNAMKVWSGSEWVDAYASLSGAVTSVTATAPITSSGGASPNLALPQASSSASGYLSSTDWSTFNSKGTGTVTSVNGTAGIGISISGGPITGSGSLTITNTAPDQTVVLNNGTGISVTGAYPNFTITNTSPSSGGTVTSVSGTGTVNGITLTGTVTASGSLTLGGTLSGVSLTTQVTGTLPVANGGTGLNAVGTNGQVLQSNGTALVFADSAVSPEIKTPTNVTPANGSTDIGATPTLTGSTYYSLYGIAMAASQWQVSTVSNFATTVVSTGDVAGTAVTYTVSSGVLSVSTTYYWRVRYKDVNGTYSDWSTGTSFTTAASFGPTVFGQAYGGGFYAGKIVQGGTSYYVIVAPKVQGGTSTLQYKTTADAAPAATQTLNNGPAASSSMNSASYPAAQFCEGLTIGGFSDWYLPSRDELELCYRNLKPTTTANNTSARPKSSYTYPEGNDVSGDTMGINRNSSPAGAAYTSGNPAQTTSAAFITGGAEAFAADYYWSSTEYSATFAWLQNFGVGYQYFDGKDISFYVRAIRRLPV